MELSDGSKVRFVGVNTPESTTTTEPYGKEASNYTKSQLTGKTVYLEKDVSETDKYGRLLRYVWLNIPKEINDCELRTKMFNAILVAKGWLCCKYPHMHQMLNIKSILIIITLKLEMQIKDYGL